MGSHDMGIHFMPAVIIRVVPLDACHPGLSPGWHIQTHSGSERYNNQKWAVGLCAFTRKAPKDPFYQGSTVSLLAEAGLQIPHLSSEQSPGEQRHTVTAPLDHPWVQVEPPVQPEIPLQRCKDPFLLGCFIFYLRKQPAQGSFDSPGQVTEQQETVPWQKTIRSCPVSCTGK